MSDVVIVGAKRTAIGSFLGQFTGVPAPTLGAAAITGALEQAGVAEEAAGQGFVGVGFEERFEQQGGGEEATSEAAAETA